MTYFRVIICVIFILQLETVVSQDVPPGECIANTYFLYCNNVTKDQIDNIVSKNNLLNDIHIYNSNLRTFDSTFFDTNTSSRLEWLFLSNDQISTINADAFDGYNNLNWLKINDNPVTELAASLFDSSPFFVELDAENCLIEELKAYTFSNSDFFRIANLQGNPIARLERATFSNLTNLVDIDLSNARIVDFPRDAFDDAHIRTLNLDNNLIKELQDDALINLGHLQFLTMNFNFFESLPYGLFSQTPSLSDLELSSNFLKEFSAKNLSLTYALNNLDLSHNTLTYVDLNEIKETSAHLQVLVLADNQWKCETLPQMIEDSHSLNTNVIWGPLNYTGLNVNGIPCQE